MITERVSDNQTVSVSESAMPKYHTLDDSVYMAEGSTFSPEYREHLDMALHNRAVAVPEEEYEDQRRYQGQAATAPVQVEAQNEAEATAPQLPSKPQIEEESTVRVFNHKRALWLAIYILLAMGVVLALLFTLPGTAWEQKTITIGKNNIMPVAEAADVPEVSTVAINTIYTPDGRSMTVELEPYAEEQPATNWFDSLCDWLNNAIGG